MADPDTNRPSSRGYHGSPVPPSPRPSVRGRDSRSSLRREQERPESAAHPRPASVAYSSRPHTPHMGVAATAAAPVEPEPPAVLSSPSPLQPTQPPFSPVFTLLASTSHSSNRQTVYYPTVHYIFADDDPETLTAALAHHHHGAAYDDDNNGGEEDKPDRGVLLDMEPTADGSGYEVAWASSLTADWAVTSACTSCMEGGGGGGGDGAAAAGLGNNLVLKIEGVSIEPSPGPTPEAEMYSSGASAGRKQSAATAAEEYADLLQDFEKRMATLRKVVEAGAARQRALGDVGGQLSGMTSRERVAAPSRPEIGGDGAQGHV